MYQKPVLQKYGSFREVTQSGFSWCFFGCPTTTLPVVGDSYQDPPSGGGGYDRS